MHVESLPNTLFHVTSTENRNSILTRGLLIDCDSTGLGAVFLTDVLPFAPGGDVWVVSVSDIKKISEDFSGDPPDGENWYMAFEDIPPSSLKLHRACAALADRYREASFDF